MTKYYIQYRKDQLLEFDSKKKMVQFVMNNWRDLKSSMVFVYLDPYKKKELGFFDSQYGHIYFYPAPYRYVNGDMVFLVPLDDGRLITWDQQARMFNQETEKRRNAKKRIGKR